MGSEPVPERKKQRGKARRCAKCVPRLPFTNGECKRSELAKQGGYPLIAAAYKVISRAFAKWYEASIWRGRFGETRRTAVSVPTQANRCDGPPA